MAAVALEKDETVAVIERVNLKLGGEGSLEIACMNRSVLVPHLSFQGSLGSPARNQT